MTTQPQRALTLREHLEELRRRLFISALALVAGTILGFVLHRRILTLLARPAQDMAPPGSTLIFTDLTEMLGISMKVSLLAGLLLASPVLLYQVMRFVAPGLTPKERRYLLLFLPGALVAFLGGVLFGYFVLIPPAFRLLLNFDADIATPMIRIANYVNLLLTLLFWMGVTFETPLVMAILAQLRVVSARTFRRGRRLAFVFAFVLAAVITPTVDPVDQTLVALPIVLLYELGIWLAWLTTRRRKTSQRP